jgi:cysteinyl-tRNA synthetase
VLDLDAGTLAVEGLGGVTIRVAGRSQVLPSGTTSGLEAIAETARSLAAGSTGTAADTAPPERDSPAEPARPARSPLTAQVEELEARFDAQLAEGAVERSVGTLLELDTLLLDWSRDTEGTGELDRARAAYRSCIVRLGEHAAARDRTASDARLAPLVDLLVDLRDRARADRDWRRADWIRDALTDAGIELRDSAEATTWVDGRTPR